MKEQQETLATVAGKTESTAERCERLEAMIGNLSTSYSKLANQYDKVEQANKEILSRLTDQNITSELLQGGGREGRPPEAPGDSKSYSNIMARLEALESQQAVLLSQSQRSSAENREANKALDAKLEQQEKARWSRLKAASRATGRLESLRLWLRY